MRKPSNDLMRTTFARTRLFANWTPEAIEELALDSEIRVYADGEMITRADDPPQGLFIVAEGLMETSRTWANGKRVVFDYHMPGQLVGIVPVCDRQQQIFDVIARGPTSVLFVPDGAFLAIVEENPRLLREVMGMLCRRTRIMYGRIEMDVLNSLRARLAKLLLYFARGFQQTEAPATPVRISQDNVAALLGVSRQSVNREMVPLIKSGIVARSYRAIEVLDFDRLVQVACEEQELSPHSRAILSGAPAHLHRASD